MALLSLRRSSSNSLRHLSALLAGVVLLAAGCHPAITDPKDPKFIVAEKGSWQITRAQLDEEVASYLRQHQTTPAQVGPAKLPMLETAMLDNMVLKKLLLERAAALPLKDVDKDEATALDQLKARFPNEQEFETQLKGAGLTLDELKKRIHEDILIRKVMEAEALQNAEPTEQEINDIYLQHKDSFNIPAKIRASRILIMVDEKTSPADKAAKKKAIDKAHDRVAHGEDFAKVATEVSQDRYSAPRGGDINFFQKGENEAQFDDVAFNTKVGALSPVFETPMGYQFLKVTDSQPAGVVPVADARAYITNKLRQMKKMEQEQAYTKKLLADAKVTFHLVRADLTPPNGEAGPGSPAAAPAPSAPASPAATSAAPPQ